MAPQEIFESGKLYWISRENETEGSNKQRRMAFIADESDLCLLTPDQKPEIQTWKFIQLKHAEEDDHKDDERQLFEIVNEEEDVYLSHTIKEKFVFAFGDNEENPTTWELRESSETGRYFILAVKEVEDEEEDKGEEEELTLEIVKNKDDKLELSLIPLKKDDLKQTWKIEEAK